MSIPVLKNRLLLLTNRDFREADFGATSFRDFLGKVPSLVKVDDSTSPGSVILLSEAGDFSRQELRSNRNSSRIRPDLWQSIIDYSSGLKYYWDASKGIARSGEPDNDSAALPTLTAADLDRFRAEFIQTIAISKSDANPAIDEWRRERLPASKLPVKLRGTWNSFLTRKVEQRLRRWFDDHSIDFPQLPSANVSSAYSDLTVEELRQFVVACVRVMSRKELADLKISPSTALRVLKKDGTNPTS